MFPLAFVAGWLQGHWWGFISRNYVVWPTFLLMNVFIALKGSHFWFLFVVRARNRNRLPGVKLYFDIQQQNLDSLDQGNIYQLTTANVRVTPSGYFRCACALAWVTDSTYCCALSQVINRNPGQLICRMLKLDYPSMRICNFPTEIPARTIQNHTWKNYKSFDLWFRTLDRQDTVSICIIGV